MIKKWDILKTTEIVSNRVFSVRQDRALSPVTGREHDFYVIEAPDWINVVAITPEGEVVLIEQYRHGIRSVTVEIPGGMVDPGETPLDAAKRELLEETGFKAEKWDCIGEVVPNPAIQDNKCYTFLAQSAVKLKEPEFDNTEDIQTFTLPAAEIPKIVVQRKITHSLVIAAFYWYHLYITTDT